MRRYIIFFILVLVTSSLFLTAAYAHPGRTDSNGGHTNHSTGEYHYHHGCPEHSHTDTDGDGDLDCPYNFRGSIDESRNADDDDHNVVTFIFVLGYIAAALLFILSAILVDYLNATGHRNFATLIEGIPLALFVISFPLSMLCLYLVRSYSKKRK